MPNNKDRPLFPLHPTSKDLKGPQCIKVTIIIFNFIIILYSNIFQFCVYNVCIHFLNNKIIYNFCKFRCLPHLHGILLPGSEKCMEI